MQRAFCGKAFIGGHFADLVQGFLHPGPAVGNDHDICFHLTFSFSAAAAAVGSHWNKDIISPDVQQMSNRTNTFLAVFE